MCCTYIYEKRRDCAIIIHSFTYFPSIFANKLRYQWAIEYEQRALPEIRKRVARASEVIIVVLFCSFDYFFIPADSGNENGNARRIIGNAWSEQRLEGTEWFPAASDNLDEGQRRSRRPTTERATNKNVEIFFAWNFSSLCLLMWKISNVVCEKKRNEIKNSNSQLAMRDN